MQPVAPSNAASIFGTTASAGGGSGTGLFASDDTGNAGDLFSQLLGGFDSGVGAGTGQDKNASASPQALQDLLANPAPHILSAQEIGAAGAQRALQQLLQQSITPQQAAELSTKLGALQGQGSDSSNSGLQQQLKDQLDQLAQASEPKTVAEIIQALPAVKEAPASSQAVASINPAAEQATMFQRALQLLHGTLATARLAANADRAATKEKDAADEEAQAADAYDPTATATDPNLLSLQAASFRPVDSTAASTASQPQAEDTKRDTSTRTEILPVSQQILVPQWVAGISPQPQLTPAVTASEPQPDLDTLIPPLTSNQAAEPALPEVSLPQVNLQPTSQGKPELFAQQLAGNGDVSAQEVGKKQNELAAVKDGSELGGATPLSPSTHSATQTAAAVQPTTATLPPHFINQAPVAQQVHVAVSRAKEDGIDHITIQLDPAHLGRVEVKFHTNSDGHTQISFTADKAETFDALSRDAHTLEHSLQEAGIKADAGSMQFNLRQQPQPQLHSDLSNGKQGQGNQPQARNEADDSVGNKTSIASISSATRHYTINLQEGVDIHA